ncbi:TnsA endonuclease N-terminal domain-containing protein [Clostridium bornimense]|uniref:TnsA endonuclease N-terminal domain-containing protein n=1 Tax=Clostridium bornimense TaxID=1216932 RepID=UPI001C1232A7|nr:TnsA endonuclease N-terminal domain-containing protein [Clostridium bornimense]MBU5317731.1 TnsA endonuclease N-terminal domain-containing protein [Clostridium bornimense]
MPRGGRKTDKYRLLEKRGTGSYKEYTPWLKVHEFGSKGRVHRLSGWKVDRVYEFMSDLEVYYFLLRQWEEKVIDIREQFPLLPLEETLLIADELGYEHPDRKSKNNTVMTTDFLITINDIDGIRNVARAIKMESECRKPRVIEKLSIEKKYWENRHIEWGIVTEKQIDKTKAINIYNIYNDYFWREYNLYSDESVNRFINIYINIMNEKGYNVIQTCHEFERVLNWDKGEGLKFFKYLLATKRVKTDMRIPFDFTKMKVYFEDK